MWKIRVFGFLVGTALLLDGLTGAPAPRAQNTPAAPPPETALQKAGDVDLRRPCTFTFTVEGGETVLHRWCPNLYGGAWEIGGIACDATIANVTVRPRLSQGADTSVLATPLTCGVEEPAGVLTTGKPRLNPRAANGAACPTPPCDLEITITAPAPASGHISVVSTLTIGPKP
jgi:hypothetical protein